MRILFLFCTLLSTNCPSAFATESRLSLSMGLDYSSGQYGSATSTHTWALPLSLKYRTDDWSVRLSSAWLRIEGDGNVTPDGDPLNSTGNNAITEGAGDMVGSFTYHLVDERAAWAGFDVTGKIKFGTASTEKFLGTGQNDYTIQAEAFKPLGNWMPFLSLGYKWKGDPDTIEYRNVWLVSLGTDYRVSPTISVGGSHDWQQAVTATGSAVSETLLYLNVRLNAANRLNLYAVGGFSDASPDWGSGFTLSHRF
ncbi:MAG: hypothetical protein ABL877_12725 [Thiobacillus sp.]